jgi:predicted DNA-binding transcriptional regulator AlpA
MDRRLTLAEVVRLIGRHRATLFRWRQQGKFPEKHPFGGRRQSDIERWLRLQRTSISSRAPDQNLIAARCPEITSTFRGKPSREMGEQKSRTADHLLRWLTHARPAMQH